MFHLLEDAWMLRHVVPMLSPIEKFSMWFIFAYVADRRNAPIS